MLDIEFIAKEHVARQHICYTYAEAPFRQQVIYRTRKDAEARGMLIRAANPISPSADASEEGLFGESLIIVDWVESAKVLSSKALLEEQASFLKLIQRKTCPNKTLALWHKDNIESCPDYPAHRKAAQPVDEPSVSKASEVRQLYEYLRQSTPLIKGQPPLIDPCRDAFISQAETLSREPEPIRALMSLFDFLATLAHDDAGKYDATGARALLQSRDSAQQDRLTDLLADLSTSTDMRPATALSRAAEIWLSEGNEQRAFVGLLYRSLHDLLTINILWGADPKDAGFSQFQARRLERYRNIPPQPLLKLHLRLLSTEPQLNTADNVMRVLFDQAAAHIQTNLI